MPTLATNKRARYDYEISKTYEAGLVLRGHEVKSIKTGGDLDNKKARSEKEAIFEQYAILSNSLDKKAEIKAHFATAYNRFGENSE